MVRRLVPYSHSLSLSCSLEFCFTPDVNYSFSDQLKLQANNYHLGTVPHPIFATSMPFSLLLTRGLENTSMLSAPRPNMAGSLSSSLICRMAAAPGNASPPPMIRTLPYNFFFISREAERKACVHTCMCVHVACVCVCVCVRACCMCVCVCVCVYVCVACVCCVCVLCVCVA